MALSSLAVPARWIEAFDVTRVFARPGLQRTLLALIASTIAPLCEEMAFRGWLLTALRTRHRRGDAIGASALLFALMHLDPVRFVALIALGTGYAWLAWRSGSIWPSIVAHATNNALGILVASAGTAAGALHEPRGSPRGDRGVRAPHAGAREHRAGAVGARIPASDPPIRPGSRRSSSCTTRPIPRPGSRLDAIPARLLATAVLGGVLLVAIVLIGHATRR